MSTYLQLDEVTYQKMKKNVFRIFSDEMYDTLQDGYSYAPFHVSEEDFLVLVDAFYERFSQLYGIKGEKEIHLCLSAALNFDSGFFFDEDPRFPWVKEYLENWTEPRLYELNQKLYAILRKICPVGFGPVHAWRQDVEFLRRWELGHQFKIAAQVDPLRHIKHSLPDRLSLFENDKAYLAFAEDNVRHANECGIHDKTHLSMLIPLATVCGHRFFMDPRHPDLRRTFLDAEISETRKMWAITDFVAQFLVHKERKLREWKAGTR